MMMALPLTAARQVELRDTATRAARPAVPALRFIEVSIARPKTPDAKGLAKTATLRLVEVIEPDPPAGAQAVHWRLLTIHAVADDAAAWMTLVAARAAAMILQLVQARDGISDERARLVFDDTGQRLLAHLDARRPAKTTKQRNPHPTGSLAWAAYIIARLGGWDGYPSSRPPGPITFRSGPEYVRTLEKGWRLPDVGMP